MVLVRSVAPLKCPGTVHLSRKAQRGYRQSAVLDKMADELVSLATKLATLMRVDVVALDEAWEPLSEDELEAEEDYNEEGNAKCNLRCKCGLKH